MPPLPTWADLPAGEKDSKHTITHVVTDAVEENCRGPEVLAVTERRASLWWLGKRPVTID